MKHRPAYPLPTVWFAALAAVTGLALFAWPGGAFQPPTYLNWAPGSPTGGGQCVVIRTDGLWENRNCSDKHEVICEME